MDIKDLMENYLASNKYSEAQDHEDPMQQVQEDQPIQSTSKNSDQSLRELLDNYKKTGTTGEPVDEQRYKAVSDALMAPKPKAPSVSPASIKNIATSEDNDDVMGGGSPSEQKQLAQVIGAATAAPAPAEEDDLKAAQRRRNLEQMFNGFGAAGQTFASAFTGKPVDHSFYENANKQADQQVQDVLLKRQQTQQKIKTQEMQQQAALMKQKGDANSPISKLYQGFVKKLDPSSEVDGVSASELEARLPALENYYKTIDNRKLMQQQMKINADSKAEDKSEKKAENLKKEQGKAYSDLGKSLETFRGNKAVQNANESLRNSDSAMALINSVPDLNSLTNEQTALLGAEIAKIATGGAATEASSKDVTAKTLQSKAAAFWQQVGGKPTGAQLGDFVQKNKEYLQHLNDVNHEYVDNYRKHIIQAYKGRIKPDDYKEAQDTYLQPRVKEGGANKIKVTNGKETLLIDPSDLDHATADGYAQVK